MKKFTLNQLTKLFPQHSNIDTEEIDIFEVFTDSRVQAENGLFIPIIGENFDAHQFIPQAIENGAVAILSSQKELNNVPEGYPVFYVEDTIKALQELATFYREEVNPIVIGVTGSNGKTTTKEIVASCMSTSYKVKKTEGNLNNHIGLPLTVLSMDNDTEVLVAEMGMSGFGEIEELSNIVKPDYGIITNIGESHIEHLGSREGIAKAKLEITSGFKENSILIYDGDEPLLKGIRPFRQVSCGFSPDHDYYITEVNQGNDSTTFKVNGQPFEIPLLGQHQAKNVSYAFAISELLNLDAEKIKNTLKHLKLPAMRFEQLRTPDGATLINDAYNASATSMVASIEVLKNLNYKKKIVVLGDILELGDFSREEHEKVGQSIDSSIDAVLTVGDESKFILEGLSPQYPGEAKHFTDQSSVIEHLKRHLDRDTAVLFKASRGMELEKIVDELLN